MISKESADNVVYGLLARVDEWNLATHSPYKVWMAAVYGSYLGDEENLGDVNVAIAFHIPKDLPPELASMRATTLKALQGTAPALSLIDISNHHPDMAASCILYLDGDVNAMDFWD